MVLFDKSSENNNKIKFYSEKDLKTNFDVPNLIDLLDSIFYVISEKITNITEMTPNKYSINNAVHISLNEKNT